MSNQTTDNHARTPVSLVIATVIKMLKREDIHFQTVGIQASLPGQDPWNIQFQCLVLQACDIKCRNNMFLKLENFCSVCRCLPMYYEFLYFISCLDRLSVVLMCQCGIRDSYTEKLVMGKKFIGLRFLAATMI